VQLTVSGAAHGPVALVVGLNEEDIGAGRIMTCHDMTFLEPETILPTTDYTDATDDSTEKRSKNQVFCGSSYYI
jgi:hypothetical protein